MIPPWKLWLRHPPAGSETSSGSLFDRLADGVSDSMGRPLNIIVWLIALTAWVAIFWIDPNFKDSQFLPAWFTSNAFNFPLNTVTTVAELFIGFLIAAAANRVEKRNRELHETIARMALHIERLVEHEGREIDEIVEAMHLPHPDGGAPG